MRLKLLGALALITVLAVLALREFGRERAERDRADSSGVTQRAAPTEEAGFEPETAPETPPEGLLRVRVVGPGNRPIEGVVLTTRSSRIYRTDSDGRASVEPEEPPQEVREVLTPRWHPLPTGETVIRIEHLLPLRVDYLDARTGLAVDGGPPKLLTDRGGVIPADDAGVLNIPSEPGPVTKLWEILLDPPAGLTGPKGLAERVWSAISVRASSLRLPVALIPEQPLKIRVVGPDGRPVAGAHIEVELFHQAIRVEPRLTDELGIATLRGVPHHPGQQLWVRAHRGDLEETVGLCMEKSPVLQRLRIELTENEFVEEETIIRYHGERDSDEAWVEPPGPETVLEAVALDLSGLPLRGGYVVVGRVGRDTRSLYGLNEFARLTVRGLEPERYWLAFVDPGIPPEPVFIELAEGRPVHVELIEPSGWTATVRVVNSDGTPVPAATVVAQLGVRGARHWQYFWTHATLQDCVQHLRTLTNADGVTVLPNLPTGGVRLRATAPDFRTAYRSSVYPYSQNGSPIVLTLPSGSLRHRCRT